MSMVWPSRGEDNAEPDDVHGVGVPNLLDHGLRQRVVVVVLQVVPQYVHMMDFSQIFTVLKMNINYFNSFQLMDSFRR